MDDRVSIEIDPETRDRLRAFAFEADYSYSTAIERLLVLYRLHQYRKRVRKAKRFGEEPPSSEELLYMDAADYVRESRRQLRELGYDDERRD